MCVCVWGGPVGLGMMCDEGWGTAENAVAGGGLRFTACPSSFLCQLKTDPPMKSQSVYPYLTLRQAVKPATRNRPHVMHYASCNCCGAAAD